MPLPTITLRLVTVLYNMDNDPKHLGLRAMSPGHGLGRLVRPLRPDTHIK